MRITIDIADALIEAACRLAAREGATVRALVEEGLRRVLADRDARARFRLRGASFRGQGLQPEVREGSWERMRERIYQGRGSWSGR
jgi:hypothetical protein